MVRLCPRKGDSAFNFAVDDQIFAAGQLALYHDGLANRGDFAASTQRFAAHRIRPDAALAPAWPASMTRWPDWARERVVYSSSLRFHMSFELRQAFAAIGQQKSAEHLICSI